MNKKLFIVMLLGIFLFVPMVSAEPPVTTVQQFAEGYSITVHPIKQYFQEGEDINFHVHVFNQSTGKPLNSSIECFFHLYNNTNHKVTLSTTTVDDLFDYEFLVLGGNFTKDVTSYHAFCENGVGGDYEYSIQVTRNGQQLTTSNAILNIGLIFLMIILFLISSVGMFSLPDKEEKQEDGTIVSKAWIKYIKPVLFMLSWGILMGVLYLSSGIALNYMINEAFGQVLFTLFKIMYFALLPMIVIWLIWIFVSIFQDKEMKRILERGGEIGDI